MRFTVRGQDGAPDRHVRVVVHLVLTWRGSGLARAREADGARVAAWAIIKAGLETGWRRYTRRKHLRYNMSEHPPPPPPTHTPLVVER